MYTNIIDVLNLHKITFKEYEHDSILNYEDAEKWRLIHNREGIESKNVFMTDNNGGYYLYVTKQGNKVDFGQMKELTGRKLNIASGEEVKSIICCVPGCVSPFGFSEEICVMVDTNIFNEEFYLFSPGITTKTIQVNPVLLKPIFENMKNVKFI